MQHPQRGLGLPATGRSGWCRAVRGRGVRLPWCLCFCCRASGGAGQRRGPVTVSAAASAAPVGDERATARLDLRGRGSGPGRGRRRLRRAARRRPPRSRAAGVSGARRSSARAAVSSSTASTRVSPSTARRSLRAAAQPIDTWSSCIAERRDRVDRRRHGEPLELGDDRRPGCTGRSCGPESTPGSSARNGGRPCRARHVEEPVGAPLGDRREVGDGDREEVQHVADGAPWKLPLHSTRPSGRTTGLSMAAASSRAATGSACASVSRTRAVHLRRAAQRVRVLHPGALRVAVARHDRRALQEDAQVGRAARLARDAAAGPAGRRRTRRRCPAAPRRSSRP